MKIEFIDNWRPLFLSDKTCSYVNDHTIFKNKEGHFCLLGTCASKNYKPWREKSFITASSKSLYTQMEDHGLLFTGQKGIKIAPHVFFQIESATYHLFFGPRNIYHYTSNDGIDWKRAKNAINGYWPGLRDPYVIKNKERYIMYATGPGNCIYSWQSNDLMTWTHKEVALKLGNGVPRSPNSSCESPTVIQVDNDFLLFTTITPWAINRRSCFENYLNTKVFISKDPTNFGIYATDRTNSADLVTTLQTHALEIITDGEKIFITTCGWKDFPKPIGVNSEGVYIREISIV